MICYFCNARGGAGGTRMGIQDAVGSCHTCGAGVCDEHSHRDATPDAPLLCPVHRQAAVLAPAR